MHKYSSGKGGDGAVSFHEKYVDKGGPDGGDGGRAAMRISAIKDLNTLLNFRYKPELIAENGQARQQAQSSRAKR